MKFDPLKTNPCVVDQAILDGTSSGSSITDPRCADATFASANPDICQTAYLVLKPESSLILKLASIQFLVFEYRNGVESQVIDNLNFTSSDVDIFVVGPSSGSGTGINIGHVRVTVTRNGLTADADVTVIDSSTGCNEINANSIVLLDVSHSSQQSFGGEYVSKLDYAKTVANRWCNRIIEVAGSPKDSVEIWSFGEELKDESGGYISDTAQLQSDINATEQLLTKTDIGTALESAISDITASTSTEKIILLISDGIHNTDSDTESILSAAASFKAAGGFIVCVGLRASGAGFDLLERIATGGFFINAYSDNAASTLDALSFIKSLLCIGDCKQVGDQYFNQPELDYSSFANWEVVSGQVDLIGNGYFDLLPNNGLYVALASSSNAATIRTIDTVTLGSGMDYTISFNAAGNNRQNITASGQKIKVYIRDSNASDSDPNIYEHLLAPEWNDAFHQYSFTFTAPYSCDARIYFQQVVADGYTGTLYGNLIDAVKFVEETTLTTLLSDNFDDENSVYLSPICGDSAAVAQVSDPASPSFKFINYSGASVQDGSDYVYAVSYITDYGETAISGLSSTDLIDFTATADRAIMVSMGVPNSASVIHKRLWRNKASGSTDVYLLATLDPRDTSYIDTETHATFSARADTGIVAPVTNSTGKSAGELGTCAGVGVSSATNPFGGLIPAMTSNTAPSGIASASTTAPTSGATDPWLAFSGIRNFSPDDPSRYPNYWESETYPTTTPQWIQYQFPEAKYVTSYQISGVYYDSSNPKSCSIGPKSWTFQGSNDGSTWDNLDAHTNYDWSAYTNCTSDPVVFTISAPGTYAYYRLWVTQSNGTGNVLISEFQMFGAPISYGDCVGCSADDCSTSSSLGVQFQDPNPLPDIESGQQETTKYTSTKTVCQSCESGQINLTGLRGTTTLEMTSYNEFTFTTIFTTAYVATAYSTASRNDSLNWSSKEWTLEASNDQTTWVELDSKSGISWTDYERKYFHFTNATAYLYYRIRFVASQINMGDVYFYGDSNATQVCKTASANSYVSQVDADNKATTAATQDASNELNCAPYFTSTKSYTAKCITGYGQDVTKTASYTSYESQADADDQALAQAKSDALAALDCTGSNNTQQITIYDNAKAAPYPSVKYASGLSGTITKVAVTLKNLSHTWPTDIMVLLVSPTGTACLLLANAGGTTVVKNQTIVFDPTASSDIGSGAAIVSGTYLPSVYGVYDDVTPPAPAKPYSTDLNDFVGETPNGAWLLYIIDVMPVNTGQLAGGWDIEITSA